MSNSIDPSAVRSAGLTLAGEPLAVDLANTEKLATAIPVDLLPDAEANRAFWALQSGRIAIPDELPSLGEVRALRSAIRSLLDSRISGRTAETWAVDSVNGFAAAAPSSPQLDDRWAATTSWRGHDGPTVLLGTVARSAIELLTGPDASRLHQCAADDCSMLFVATNAKRQWCTSAGCGNRHRVAQHARRQFSGVGVSSPTATPNRTAATRTALTRRNDR